MSGHVLRKIIGIDALKLVGFSIEIVNEEKFHEADRMKIIEIEYRKKPNVISDIHIVNDKLFKSLRWEKKETEYRKYEISALELTVSNNGNNLNPMLVNEVNARLETINYHLVNDMGIIMRTEGFYINSMEININVFKLKIISRGRGGSAINAAAYRACEKLYNPYDGRIADYTRKTGNVYQNIILPENAPVEFCNREKLWGSLEEIEKNKRSQLCREITIALPKEFDLNEQIKLVNEYCHKNFVEKGMACDINIHDKGDDSFTDCSRFFNFLSDYD